MESHSYPIHVAKAKLSELIDRALKGESITILRGKEPIVTLQPVASKKRGPGRYAGQIVMHDSFFDPMTDEEMGLSDDAFW